MIGHHYQKTENLAATKRMRRNRRVRRWVVLAGSVSWCLLIPSEIVMGADQPVTRTALATVQVVEAPPFSLHNEAPVVERRHRYRIEDNVETGQFDVVQASSEQPVESDSEVDLSQRAAELGQRMRERFFSPPATKQPAPNQKSNATPVAARSTDFTQVRAASNPANSKTGGMSLPEQNPRVQKHDSSILRPTLSEANQVPVDHGTEPTVPVVIQQQTPTPIAPESTEGIQPHWKSPQSQSLLGGNQAQGSSSTYRIARDSSVTSDSPSPAESRGMPGSWVLEVSGTHRIRVPQNIAAIQVSNPIICEVLQVGIREVVVIGKTTGIATVHLSFESGSPEQQYVFRVSRQADGNGPTEETLSRLESLLAQKFPGRGIELLWSQESLVVNGTANDRQEAIQILAFVRDTYLVPVVDRLEVPRGKPGSRR